MLAGKSAALALPSLRRVLVHHNLGFGLVTGALGVNASFLGLAAVAVAGGALHALKLSETKPGAAAAPT